MDQEIPEYDMDSEDEQWLTRQVRYLRMEVTPVKFENMMDRLEKANGQSVSVLVMHLCPMLIMLISDTLFMPEVKSFFSIKFRRSRGAM